MKSKLRFYLYLLTASLLLQSEFISCQSDQIAQIITIVQEQSFEIKTSVTSNTNTDDEIDDDTDTTTDSDSDSDTDADADDDSDDSTDDESTDDSSDESTDDSSDESTDDSSEESTDEDSDDDSEYDTDTWDTDDLDIEVYDEDEDEGTWTEGEDFGTWSCTNEGADFYVLKLCQGSGFEEGYLVTWIYSEKTYIDGNVWYEYSENGISYDQFNTYGYYENTAGEWFLGVTTETTTFYQDHTGYTFQDLQQEVTKAEDDDAHYWKSKNGNGEIMYTKTDDYAQYVGYVMDDDQNVLSLWGWDSDGMMWTYEDGEYSIEDVTGNIAYYDYDMEAYVLYDAFDGRMYEWDETRHMMLQFVFENGFEKVDIVVTTYNDQFGEAPDGTLMGALETEHSVGYDVLAADEANAPPAEIEVDLEDDFIDEILEIVDEYITVVENDDSGLCSCCIDSSFIEDVLGSVDDYKKALDHENAGTFKEDTLDDDQMSIDNANAPPAIEEDIILEEMIFEDGTFDDYLMSLDNANAPPAIEEDIILEEIIFEEGSFDDYLMSLDNANAPPAIEDTSILDDILAADEANAPIAVGEEIIVIEEVIEVVDEEILASDNANSPDLIEEIVIEEEVIIIEEITAEQVAPPLYDDGTLDDYLMALDNANAPPASEEIIVVEEDIILDEEIIEVGPVIEEEIVVEDETIVSEAYLQDDLMAADNENAPPVIEEVEEELIIEDEIIGTGPVLEEELFVEEDVIVEEGSLDDYLMSVDNANAPPVIEEVVEEELIIEDEIVETGPFIEEDVLAVEQIIIEVSEPLAEDEDLMSTDNDNSPPFIEEEDVLIVLEEEILEEGTLDDYLLSSDNDNSPPFVEEEIVQDEIFIESNGTLDDYLMAIDNDNAPDIVEDGSAPVEVEDSTDDESD